MELQEHGVMLTDYFHGTPGVMLAVPVDKNTTLSELLQGLKNEITMVGDHIEYTAGYHEVNPDLVFSFLQEELDRMELFISQKPDELYNPDLDYTFDTVDEYEELPMAIFSLEFD